MIYTSRIRSSLDFLEQQYSLHVGSRQRERPIMFAKLAVLEYCGWLEESFDELARNCVRSKLRTKQSRDILEARIKITHGFVYQTQARPLIGFALGTVRLLRLERELARDGSLDVLRTNLEYMSQLRNRAAHTFTRGATSSYDAPSAVIRNFNQTSPILLQMWKHVIHMGDS